MVELFGEDRPRLTPRELECLRWIALGKDTTEIATILSISMPYTTRDYVKSVHYKLDCVTSAQAVTKAVKLGLLVVLDGQVNCNRFFQSVLNSRHFINFQPIFSAHLAAITSQPYHAQAISRARTADHYRSRRGDCCR